MRFAASCGNQDDGFARTISDGGWPEVGGLAELRPRNFKLVFDLVDAFDAA